MNWHTYPVKVLGSILSGGVKIALGLIILVVVLKSWIEFENSLARAKLPPGVYLAAVNPISEGHREIALFRDDGLMLVPPYIDFVCFNTEYVDTIGSIYKKGSDRALTSADPGYLEMIKESRLSGPSGGCRGEKDSYYGYSLLIKDSNYRRDWWEWWRPFGRSDSEG
ncbi:MAG: hypothetical protein AAGC95_06485 [Pseudomonadota bacterium]